MIIQELLLRKASNIRKEYLSIRRNIDHYEGFTTNLVKAIEERGKELVSLQEKINSGRISSVDQAKDELVKIIISLEEEANSIEVLVSSMNSKMDKLRDDENSLYRDIKHKYPDLSDEEIKKDIHEYINKQNLS